MGYMFYIWTIIMVLSVIIEIATTDLTSLWFSIGAFFALICSLFTKNNMIYVQIGVFSLVSILSILLLRPLIKKKMNSPTLATNVDSLVGKIVEVVSPISTNQPGSIKYEGIIWTAVTEIDNFEQGELVKIQSIVGNTVHIVKNERKENI